VEKRNVPGPKAKEILEKDSKYVSHSYPRVYPFVMDYGKGSEVWDVDGNRYIDMAAGLGVASTGHSHPKVVEAIQKQAEKFIHISSDYYHQTWADLSERLASLAPFSEPARVFLANSGTESVEAATKLARRHTGRPQFIGFYGGFHGRTMGSLAFTASKSIYRQGFQPIAGGVTHVPYPDVYRPLLHNDGGDYGQTVIDYIENVVFRHVVPPDECAGVLVEPIQGEGGYIVPPDSFLPALRELCDKYGMLLVTDEVQSGLGRTGKWWAGDHWSVEPDIIVTAKAIASGIPLGGIIARESVMDWPSGAHGNTYGGNPIACSAALATLDLIENGLMQNAAEVGEYAIDALSEIQVRHPSIGDVRGKGLMIGIDFVKDRDTKEYAKGLRDRIVWKAFEYGIVTFGCGESTIRLSPSLAITRDQVDESLTILEGAITEAEAEGLD
jgi:4-aminobutyrate aminotransferase